jgi:hypothetical protein
LAWAKSFTRYLLKGPAKNQRKHLYMLGNFSKEKSIEELGLWRKVKGKIDKWKNSSELLKT